MGSLHRQAGFSLLLYVLMILGMGGLLLEGYLQNARAAAERQKEEHDRKVLEEAKTALLQYAYNYGVLGSADNGPGRLPCSDTDNDGQSDTTFGSCDSIGRFPWDEPLIKTGDLRDSSGERLWYVPSSNFMTQYGGAINADSSGTITIKDQGGEIIYDGAINGVAAVIIAPGSPLDRNGSLQNRSVNNGDDPDDTNADTDPGIINPENYLDLNGSQDNATLTHLSSSDGFQLGPVMSAQNEIVINDRILVVTAEEVIEVAQKAVLQAYARAIKDWQQTLWGSNVANYRYPWLDDLSSITDLSDHDANVGASAGQVASLFAGYFDATSPVPSKIIESELTVRVNYKGFDVPETDLDSGQLFTVSFDQNGNLQIEPSLDQTTTLVRYFWDEQASPDGWQLCPPVTGTEQDCNQSLSAPGVPNPALTSNQVPLRVVQITFSRNFSVGNTFQQLLVDRTSRPLSYRVPDLSFHAGVLAEFDDVAGDELDVSYVYDSYYHNSFDNQESGTFDKYELGIRFYPSLPAWALPANDNWHDSVLMVYSSALSPGGSGTCISNNDNGAVDTDECLLIRNLAGAGAVPGLLLLAGEHDLVDEANDGFDDDLVDIFEGENATPGNLVFDARPPVTPGNRPDVLLPLD